jgi:hypothetical protein
LHGLLPFNIHSIDSRKLSITSTQHPANKSAFP